MTHYLREEAPVQTYKINTLLEDAGLERQDLAEIVAAHHLPYPHMAGLKVRTVSGTRIGQSSETSKLIREPFATNHPTSITVALVTTECAMKAEAELYGNAVPATAAMRAVHITPSTKYVNVMNGEAVRFVSGGHTLSWTFDAPPTLNRFDSAEIAPADALDHKMTAYISPDPKYPLP